MSYDNNGGGNGGWKTWALGLFVGLAFAVLSWGWNFNSNRLDAYAAVQQAHIGQNAKQDAEIAELRASMLRIEHKLDQVLERRQ